MTRTYAILEVPRAVYDEIRRLLEDAEYQHAFHEDGEGETIDMDGLALRVWRCGCPERASAMPCREHWSDGAPYCHDCGHAERCHKT